MSSTGSASIIRAILLLTTVATLAGCTHSPQAGRLAHSHFADLLYLSDGRSARASSFDRSGGNVDAVPVGPGQTVTLAEIPGAGCIRHIYFTTTAAQWQLRDLMLRMYWDGEESPSVEVPFGDFFGLGHERGRFFHNALISVNPGGAGITGTYGFNAYFPMPFSDGARLTLSNDGPSPVGAVWYHINYETFDSLEDGVGRFHAQWRRENLTTAVGDKPGVTLHEGINLDGNENYVILDAKGHGNLAGYFLNIDNVSGDWYGEGDDMIFIDGEQWPPSFHGTGTEEIFGGGAGPNTEFLSPYAGFYLVGNPDYSGKVSLCRFFIPDPIRFNESIRVTIEHGHANNFANDYSSTAFWYQTEPHAPFPPLAPAAERRPLEGKDPHDVAFLKLEEMGKVAGEIQARIAAGTLQLNPDDIPRVLAAFSTTVPEAFRSGDYEAAREACDKALAEMRAILDRPSKTGENQP